MANASTKRKNVILLHADQQRADSLGCMGNRFARTPNLDGLAGQGTVFTRHIVSNPICQPSRASLLTGLYPPGHNLWCNGIALNRREYVPLNSSNERQSADASAGFVPEPTTIADMFAAAGFDTAAFGKLHLTPYLAPGANGYPESFSLWETGALDDWHGPYYGFRHVELTTSHGDGVCRRGHYANWLRREHPDVERGVCQAEPLRPFPEISDLYVSTLPSEVHHSAWLAHRLCHFIRSGRAADRPFFAFVGFPDPHHPFTPCSDIAPQFEQIDVLAPLDPEGAGLAGSPSERLCQMARGAVSPAVLRQAARYTYALVHQIDLSVGRILDVLEAEGLSEDTLVAFTSDHGDFLGDHGLLRKGFSASDSLLHVPFILRAPGAGLPARVSVPMSNCDVLPTLARLAGVELPTTVHGDDMVRLLQEGREHHAFAFSSNGDPESVHYTVYDHTHRLTWYPAVGYLELFNHQTDPGETRNLAGELGQNGRVRHLRALLAECLAACHNPILGRTCAW